MTFSGHFLSCNLTVSILLAIILLLKRILKKHMTLSSQYHIWYIFILVLFFPFVPASFFSPNPFLLKLQNLFNHKSEGIINVSAYDPLDAAQLTGLGLSDFAPGAGHSAGHVSGTVFQVTWMLGCAVTIVYFIYNVYTVYKIKKASYLITAENEQDLYRHFAACMEELKIERRVALYASCNVPSPVSYGLIRPTVIIPQDMDILLQEHDIRFIFLHELQHYKNKDVILNYLSCIFQILYWFNPFVWHTFHVMQKDRKIRVPSFCTIWWRADIIYIMKI